MTRSCPASDAPPSQSKLSAAAASNKPGSARRSRRFGSVAAGRVCNSRLELDSAGWSRAGSSAAWGRPISMPCSGSRSHSIGRSSCPSAAEIHRSPRQMPATSRYRNWSCVGRAAGYVGSFELSTRPAEPWRSVDVGLEFVARRRLILNECWNTIGDVGAAARSSSRKLAELEDLATARWGSPAEVGLLWVVRATARNRALVSRYPEVFASRFPGSSRRWLAALTTGAAPPSQPGLVWCDVGATRLYEWRRVGGPVDGTAAASK
jgi:hypothetical protein